MDEGQWTDIQNQINLDEHPGPPPRLTPSSKAPTGLLIGLGTLATVVALAFFLED